DIPMGAVARLKNLQQLSGEPQLKALVQAIDLELSLPGLYLDLHGGKAANDPTVTLLGNQRKAEGPKPDHIKAALAQKYATPTDTPQSSDVAARIDQWFHTGMQEIDTGWTNLFRFVDMRGGNQDS